MILLVAETTVAFAGTSFTTTHPAPIRALSPILTAPIILAPAPIITPSPTYPPPIRNLLSFNALEPIVTCWNITQSLPI